MNSAPASQPIRLFPEAAPGNDQARARKLDALVAVGRG
jgi:hypothetical protein